MTKPLRDRPTKELREEVTMDLNSLLTDLLLAAQKTHTAIGMSETTKVKFAGALDMELDEIADRLRDASEHLRTAQSAWAVVGTRKDDAE